MQTTKTPWKILMSLNNGLKLWWLNTRILSLFNHIILLILIIVYCSYEKDWLNVGSDTVSILFMCYTISLLETMTVSVDYEMYCMNPLFHRLYTFYETLPPLTFPEHDVNKSIVCLSKRFIKFSTMTTFFYLTKYMHCE